MNNKYSQTRWSKLISELREKGYTQQRIADETGSKRSTIADLETGRSAVPMGDLALKLHDLHQEAFIQKRRRKLYGKASIRPDVWA